MQLEEHVQRARVEQTEVTIAPPGEFILVRTDPSDHYQQRIEYCYDVRIGPLNSVAEVANALNRLPGGVGCVECVSVYNDKGEVVTL